MEGKETALGLCLIYTLMFVFSLYIWEESRDRSLRDYPSVVIKRFLSVFMSTFLSAVMTLWFGVTFDEFGVPLKDPLESHMGHNSRTIHHSDIISWSTVFRIPHLESKFVPEFPECSRDPEFNCWACD